MYCVGAHEIREREDTLTVRVSKKIVHDSFKRVTGSVVYNHALLKLSRIVDYGSYPHIRPVCLPDGEYKDYDEERGVVGGWGDEQVQYERRGELVRGRSSNPAPVLQKLGVRYVVKLLSIVLFYFVHLD